MVYTVPLSTPQRCSLRSLKMQRYLGIPLCTTPRRADCCYENLFSWAFVVCIILKEASDADISRYLCVFYGLKFTPGNSHSDTCILSIDYAISCIRHERQGFSVGSWRRVGLVGWASRSGRSAEPECGVGVPSRSVSQEPVPAADPEIRRTGPPPRAGAPDRCPATRFLRCGGSAPRAPSRWGWV